ncbi:MAG: aminoglycoside phosphotransferase family protein [Pedobacter sp.]
MEQRAKVNPLKDDFSGSTSASIVSIRHISESVQATPYGTGLINQTCKIDTPSGSFILQKINTDVFQFPERIDHNLSLIRSHLHNTFPEYLFAGPVLTLDGKLSVTLTHDIFRLQPFVAGSHTVDAVSFENQAYQAAKQFARFGRLLKDLKPADFSYPLENFHNLDLRIEQFNKALQEATEERITSAGKEIEKVKNNLDIALRYTQIVSGNLIPLRIIHHDTKISNVLFDTNGTGICVIDLDTVMPGYFISDVGDMMRTYLSQATEEEPDFDKITLRHEIFNQIYKGYMEEMGGELTAVEEELFVYSGKFMIYMQAVRFLTDFLNGDRYYPIKYPLHNLMRAGNQLVLLERYIEMESVFL